MFNLQKLAFFTLCTALFSACSEGDVRETVHYNGIRKTQVAYVNGKPHGEFKRWTSHGDLAESGTYENGLREGTWTEWFTNGKVQSQGEYQNGKRQGLWKGFFQDGTVAWEHTYRDNEPIGTWIEYYPLRGNIRVSSERNPIKEKNSCFKNSSEGFRETYSVSGKMEREETCRFGVLDGIVKAYYPGGSLESILEYKNGTLDGKATYFRARNGFYQESRAPGKKFREGFYKNGIRDSIWTYYGKDGLIQKTSLFVNGNGIAYGELDSNGFNAETTFVEGVVHDSLRYKLPGHNLQFVEVWDKGEKKVLLAYYEKSGTLASEGNFVKGKRNGFWRNWYENGMLKDSLFYKDDEPFGEQLYYDSTGKLYMRKKQIGKNGPVQVNFQ
ncbi:MAG: hypothetical protein J6Z31_08955 [Fibrobacter sp.]|nr:hypothetical protein [Fibrobacter sp.]